jgi:hypothetical protein
VHGFADVNPVVEHLVQRAFDQLVVPIADISRASCRTSLVPESAPQVVGGRPDDSLAPVPRRPEGPKIGLFCFQSRVEATLAQPQTSVNGDWRSSCRANFQILFFFKSTTTSSPLMRWRDRRRLWQGVLFGFAAYPAASRNHQIEPSWRISGRSARRTIRSPKNWATYCSAARRTASL